MKKMLPALLGLLTAYLLVSLFYARLEEDATIVVQKNAANKKTAEQEKKRAERDKKALLATEERRHRELVEALRTGVQRNSASVINTSSERAASTAASDTTPAGEKPSPGVSVSQSLRNNQSVKQTSKPALADQARAQLWWLLPGLGLLGAVLLGRFAWVGWRDSQVELLLPDRSERDTPVLEMLLRTFAGPIGRALPIPRQVKRFASKARLQHNLLHALARSTSNGPNPFQFGPKQQVLAFLLLLLLEEETARENFAKSVSGLNDAPLMRLRETEQELFATELRSIFTAWHQTGTDASNYAAFAQAAGRSIPTYSELPTLLTNEASDRLLVQLYRLNAGLLV
ncbi:hypothetical protein [Hymenobacter cavernae]|uniref:DUF4129 domain-containing protein n=1 Tax=Hymenobacter cavernae TaxID=2044852 RepID=A0ABQ1UVF3_9BACT|nr:hypothetical protein [Hymenobacter cavernae]GGF26208.1 hypothetical protein GCM10011383_42160 [Hymenobacter cavernae]